MPEPSMTCDQCGESSSQEMPAAKFTLYAVERISAGPKVVKICPSCEKQVQRRSSSRRGYGVTRLANK